MAHSLAPPKAPKPHVVGFHPLRQRLSGPPLAVPKGAWQNVAFPGSAWQPRRLEQSAISHFFFIFFWGGGGRSFNLIYPISPTSYMLLKTSDSFRLKLQSWNSLMWTFVAPSWPARLYPAGDLRQRHHRRSEGLGFRLPGRIQALNSTPTKPCKRSQDIRPGTQDRRLRVCRGLIRTHALLEGENST